MALTDDLLALASVLEANQPGFYIRPEAGVAIRRLVRDATRPCDGYAYLYPGHTLRFNDGKEVNGSKPVKAIAYWLDASAEVPDNDGPALVTLAPEPRVTGGEALSVGKGTHRVVSVDLLATIAGALAATGCAPNTLAKVREVIAADGVSA